MTYFSDRKSKLLVFLETNSTWWFVVDMFHFYISVSPHWDAMKMSLMIEEANKISSKLKKNTIFRRYCKCCFHLFIYVVAFLFYSKALP